MKLIAIFSLAILSLYTKVFAQNGNEIFFPPPDTVYRYQGIIPPLEFQYDLNEIYSQPITIQLPDDVLFDENPSTVWLRTELLVSNHSLLFNEKEISTHFTSSLYQKHLQDAEFDMVSYVLGMAQLSAVADLAYRHIKKHGFWK
jgi:hypothetical protein